MARDFALAEMYVADQVFITGTMGERTPVRMNDGHVIGNQYGPRVFEQLLQAFKAHMQASGYPFG